ncbi:MAG TPA: hypothetical protein VEU96_01565 [Bryobacteraceae bacterium]|nr:hypothetical protein [Bryobacteraceae bacterium]
MDRLSGLVQSLKQWFVESDLVAGNSHKHKAHPGFGEILLVLKAAINRHKDVEVLFGKREKGTVFAAAEPNLNNGLDIVARKSRPHSGVDAFV